MKKLANKNKKFPTIKRKTFNENNEIPNLSPNTIIHNQFKIIEKLGQGSFGQVYLVEKIGKSQFFAVKVEFLKMLRNSTSLLEKEAEVLEKLENEEGFPKLHSLFKKEEKNFMVMSLCGDDLSVLLSKCGGKFSLKTTLIIGYQMIIRLEILHNLGYVHRDLKPENIAIGQARSKKSIFLIDFGLSKEFKDKKGEQIPMSVRKGIVGTARYTSINSHLGIEFSRRDDLESLFYILAYLVDGGLPWQKVYGRSKMEKYEAILQLKSTTHPFIVCRSLSREIGRCLEYVKNLQYDEEPNYNLLKMIFESEMKKKGWNLDDALDWEEKESYKKMSIIPKGDEREEKELQKFNTCPHENEKINFLNVKTNYQEQESFGTSKAVNLSSGDLAEKENDERTINKFYQTENMNPKFMKFSKKSEKRDFDETENENENEKIDCYAKEIFKK